MHELEANSCQKNNNYLCYSNAKVFVHGLDTPSTIDMRTKHPWRTVDFFRDAVPRHETCLTRSEFDEASGKVPGKECVFFPLMTKTSSMFESTSLQLSDANTDSTKILKSNSRMRVFNTYSKIKGERFAG